MKSSTIVLETIRPSSQANPPIRSILLNAYRIDLDTYHRYPEFEVVARILNLVFRRPMVEPPIPICPDHGVEMQLRGKLGRPTRFADMTQETYQLIYYCPVPGCDFSKEVEQVRSQIPVPGAQPTRPDFSRRRSGTPVA